jgi:DNA-binding IclR family transcriptional regulator
MRTPTVREALERSATPLTIRELMEQTGKPHATVWRELQRLEDAGIVTPGARTVTRVRRTVKQYEFSTWRPE